jgi:hypothetical protein
MVAREAWPVRLSRPAGSGPNRWEAYLTDDEPPELAFYCPECAEREFGHE